MIYGCVTLFPRNLWSIQRERKCENRSHKIWPQPRNHLTPITVRKFFAWTGFEFPGFFPGGRWKFWNFSFSRRDAGSSGEEWKLLRGLTEFNLVKAKALWAFLGKQFIELLFQIWTVTLFLFSFLFFFFFFIYTCRF